MVAQSLLEYRFIHVSVDTRSVYHLQIKFAILAERQQKMQRASQSLNHALLVNSPTLRYNTL